MKKSAAGGAAAAAVAGPLASRAEAAVPTPRQVVPDGCNLGVVLRVLVGVNALLFLYAVAVAPAAGRVFDPFLEGAALVEPATLLTLVTWCLLRRLLPAEAERAAPAGRSGGDRGRQAARLQRLAAWAVPPAWTLLLLAAFGALSPAAAVEQPGWRLFACVLLAAAGGVGAQHYLELRARAFSPAVAEARFQALQSRIRPHFFFNSLNAVLAIVRADPVRAERMLESLSDLFRAVMGDVRKLVPFELELGLCRQYLEIEQTRLGERLQVEWQIGAVHPRARVPQLLLQPVIENAVRYGAERIEGECRILIRIRQVGFNLEFFVSNPIAREPIQREGNQIGLDNIRGRLALIYDLEARLEARERDGRFELTMTIPVENKA